MPEGRTAATIFVRNGINYLLHSIAKTGLYSGFRLQMDLAAGMLKFFA
jgi:hypothetical protein